MRYLKIDLKPYTTLYIALFLPFFILLSCSSDDTEPEVVPDTQETPETPEPEPEPEPQGLFADILLLGTLPNAMPSLSSDTTSVSTLDNKLARELFNGNLEDVRYTCSEVGVTANAINNAIPIWGAPPSVVHTGSFLQGASLAQGSPEAIPAKRAGGALILKGADEAVLGTTDIPEFNTTEVSLGRTALLSEFTPAAASFQVDVLPVANGDHLAFEMGISETDFQALQASGLSVEFPDEGTTVLVALRQKYYTVAYELPLDREGYFDADVAPSDIAPHVSEENPAAFVSEVEYGRQFYVLLQTSTFANTALEKIGEAFGTFENAVAGSLQTDVLNDLESLSITVAVQSNNAQGPFEELGEVGMGRLADLLSEPVSLATAQAVSYEVRGISQTDNKAGYVTEAIYDLVLCDREGALPPEGFAPLVHLFEDGIGAAFFFDRGHITVFNGAGTEYAWLNVSTGQISPIYGIKDPDGLLPVLFPESVRAAFAGSNAGTIYIFDGEGAVTGIYVNTNTLSNNDPTAFPTEAPIRPFISSFSGELVTSEINPFWQTASAPGETAPFLESGIEAAVYMGRENQTDPTDDASYSNYQNFFEKGQANLWAERDVRVVNRSADYFWSPVNDLRDVDRAVFPFEEVGAACALELERDVYQQVYFNKEGTQFFIANTDEQLVAGPYLLY